MTGIDAHKDVILFEIDRLSHQANLCAADITRIMATSTSNNAHMFQLNSRREQYIGVADALRCIVAGEQPSPTQLAHLRTRAERIMQTGNELLSMLGHGHMDMSQVDPLTERRARESIDAITDQVGKMRDMYAFVMSLVK